MSFTKMCLDSFEKKARYLGINVKGARIHLVTAVPWALPAIGKNQRGMDVRALNTRGVSSLSKGDASQGL